MLCGRLLLRALPKEKEWGEKVGNAIYFFSYIIIPIAVGENRAFSKVYSRLTILQ